MSSKTAAWSGPLAATIVVGGSIAVLDGVLDIGHSGSLVFTLLFWLAVSEGAIALGAAIETAQGKWLKPLKRYLFSLYPILIACTFLSFFMSNRLHLYPWFEFTSGIWLVPSFFMVRNCAVLMLTCLSAGLYIRNSLRETAAKGAYAVFYLFCFVLSQSLLAFDWVMSLDYPWVSTLFGGYFFTESFFIGLATAGIILFLLYIHDAAAFADSYQPALKDIATFTFGFSLLWAGLFFAQFLVIWYGHIPEETGYFSERLASAPISFLAYAIVPLFFIIPFIALMFRKSKTNPFILLCAASIIFAGYGVERVVMLAPRMPLNPMTILAEFTVFALLAVFLVWRKIKE